MMARRIVVDVLAAFGVWCICGLLTLLVLYAPWRHQQ